MKSIPCSLLLALAVSASLRAQLPVSSTLPRGEHQLTSNYTNVLTHGYGNWRLASPRDVLPAGPAGTVATAQVAYVTYMDKDLQNRDALMFRRSIDGGRTWLAPQTLYTLSTGEIIDTNETRLVAFEHEVYLVFASNVHALTAAQGVWAMGSADQGQTWTAPVLASTGVLSNLFDVDEVNAAAARGAIAGPGLLHIVYEADYAQPVSGIEDIFYVQLAIQGGALAVTVPEQRLNHAAPAVTHDVNFTSIAAQGPVVHVAWTDNRSLGGTRQYDYFSMTSRNDGLDWVTTNEFRHTTLLAPLSWDTPRRPRVAVDVPNVYTFMEYAPNGKDDVFMDWSFDVGVTWSHTGVAINTATLGSAGDVDDMMVTASGNRVAVLYVDDRLNGTNNNDNNQAIVSVSQNGGSDFVNGTHVEVPLSILDPNPIFGIEMVGDMIACIYETRCGSGQEDFTLSLSADGGHTFTHHDVTQFGQCGLRANTTDVDNPQMVLTQNGDCIAAWIDDRSPLQNGLGNSYNHVYTTGIHYPQLLDQTAAFQGLRYQDASPATAGDLVLVLASGSGTQTPWALDNLGFSVNLTFDFWTGASLSAFGTPAGPGNLTLGITDPYGTVQFAAIPNVTQLLGLPIWAAAITIGPAGLREFTDPIRFQ
jgi:ATP-dependent protease HslVU (ClpYQ) peptidase subunit